MWPYGVPTGKGDEPKDKGSRHRCFRKIRRIFEQTGLVLTHAEITFLCEHVLGAHNETEFWDKYNEETKGMGRDEERAWVKAKLKKIRGQLTGQEEKIEVAAYT